MLREILSSLEGVDEWGGILPDYILGPSHTSSSSSSFFDTSSGFGTASGITGRISNYTIESVLKSHRTSFVYGNYTIEPVSMPPELTVDTGAPKGVPFVPNPSIDATQRVNPLLPRDDGLDPEEVYVRQIEQEKLLPSRQVSVVPESPPIEDQLDGLYLGAVDTATQPSTMLMPPEKWNGGFRYRLYLEERIFRGIVYGTIFISLSFAFGINNMVYRLRQKHFDRAVEENITTDMLASDDERDKEEEE